jgi:hypothetical protein
MKDQIVNIYGKNWLVKEAVSLEAALDEIAMAECTGSVGSSTEMKNGNVAYVMADVCRLDKNGCECLAYGEVGEDHSSKLENVIYPD